MSTTRRLLTVVCFGFVGALAGSVAPVAINQAVNHPSSDEDRLTFYAQYGYLGTLAGGLVGMLIGLRIACRDHRDHTASLPSNVQTEVSTANYDADVDDGHSESETQYVEIGDDISPIKYTPLSPQ